MRTDDSEKEEAKCLALKKKATSQRTEEASRSWKGREEDSLLELPEKSGPTNRLTLSLCEPLPSGSGRGQVVSRDWGVGRRRGCSSNCPNRSCWNPLPAFLRLPEPSHSTSSCSARNRSRRRVEFRKCLFDGHGVWGFANQAS